MPSGARLARLIREFDRELSRLERDAIARLDGHLRYAAARLEAELRRLYGVALTDLKATDHRLLREARARLLLEQVRAGLDLTRGAQATTVLEALIAGSFEVGERNALTVLGEFQRQLVTLSSNARLTVAARATQASARLAHHGQDFALKAEQLVVDGIVRGRGWGRVATELRRETSVTRWKAEQIVRTESVSASHDARTATYAENGVEYGQWVSVMDSVVCGYCAERSGKVYKLQDIVIPAHPNCVVGDTVVSAANVSAYTRRWYEGPVVTITTRGGHRLTVTPNHPVLTPSGWVPAGSLNVGSHVLSQGGSDRVRFISEPDHEQVHGVVEELADAFFQSPQVATAPVPVSDEHFHGDGRGSKVAVIAADSHLRPGLHAQLAQQSGEVFFLGAVMQTLGLQRPSRALKGGAGHPAAPRRFVSGLDLLGALLGRHPGPLDPFGFLPRSDGDPALPESTVHCERCGSELEGEGAGALPSFIAADQLVPGEVRSGGGAYASPGQDFRDAGSASAVGAGEGPDALPFAVTPDDVVAIERSGFAGHVYNLETAAGMYVANGIMTHNCRCYTSPWKREWAELGLTDDDWYREHHKTAMSRTKAKPTGSKPSPFERSAGLEKAPEAVWSP